MRRLFARLRALAKRLDSEQESGAALIEFSVVFPAQLFVTLGIMQLSLIMVGHIVVQHAAFAAARAALVQDVPAPGAGHGGGGGASGVTQQMTDAAMRAAAVVLAPIARPDVEIQSGGKVRSQDGTTRDFTSVATPQDSDLHWPASGQLGPALFPRIRGAYLLTTLTLEPSGVATPDVCVAQVRFELPLVIPVVARFFAQAGPYMAYGVPANADSPGIVGTVYPTLTITKDGFVPRPWSRQ